MEMLNSIMQPGEYEQRMNKQFFRSNHKDYASMCKPLSETMLPLFQARQPRDVANAYNDILDKMKPMTQEVREAEVRNFLLNLLADKKHPEYKEMKAWVGRGFNPNKFNVSKV